MNTIFALASAPGKAGVSVIRLSGPEAFAVAEHLSGSGLPSAGRSLRVLRDAEGTRLDQVLVLTFSGPASFTGEDVVEFHAHGSPAGTEAILRSIGESGLARIAEPGEFTRRALENGKLDLAQVEGLADLIDAETEAQRRQAMRVFSGDLGKLAETWRVKLIRAAALIEATIDFADEDVPEDVTPEVLQLLHEVSTGLSRHGDGAVIAERIRSGFEVAIIGAPNVGKSTLLNALAGRQAAITSDVAGTTRDVIEVRMDLGGIPVTLLDTAGIRETADSVEQIGVHLARQRAEAADLRVFLTLDDVSFDVEVRPDDIVLLAKADGADWSLGHKGISGLTGAGVDSLVSYISNVLSSRSASAGLAIRQRHRDAIRQASASLEKASALLLLGAGSYDIAAYELRHAVLALESLVGRIDVESLLDEIFASFCLGK
ncbi:tRNA uridine-5-carboxymethylaminomethyl(34) synthesis GTPase MnmE [Arenibacterium halophilum]|uniref:tRNA modification GTPase MnmE n=1 Tax=Arenibacterium halophilum TaxID=2583821 RepID=A0ABY2X5L4_9RHOB|nr:tRNA uridine-5-carboxymethylaminomethyl(34) synthesis GTPase MnmE [Arenibacterium halophilum]TMV10744.1 tRNA uridine-5-carboxymethylaminomethyl(34) synthesis GTPase MnmE [Arenibacterium halophilum]